MPRSARFGNLNIGAPMTVEQVASKLGKRNRTGRYSEDLARLMKEVAAGADSQVWPWYLDNTENAATARLAANKAIKDLKESSGVTVYVTANKALAQSEGGTVLLFSKTKLSRQGTK